LSGAPSACPRTASGPWPITPLCVFTPVTMAVMPAAESVTHSEAVLVSERPICGIRCTYSRRGSPYPNRLAALIVGRPAASASSRITLRARVTGCAAIGAMATASATVSPLIALMRRA
jgi:hypothetical protein